MGPGDCDHGAWRPAMAGGQCLLAAGLARGAGRAVVEWLPGADHCWGAPGIEPFAAALCPASRAVSAGRECLAGGPPASGAGFHGWWTRHRGGDDSPGVLAAAV